MSVIEIHNLKKTFSKSSIALKGINLTVASGDMVALIGPSGSGKSTLMRHISGLTLANKDTNGFVRVFDHDIQRNGRLNKNIRANRARIGHVFQQFNLVNRLSVMTNVLIGGLSRIPSYRSLLGWFTEEEKRAALEALDRVGLKDFALHKASELSGGQQQRVAIARALMQKADIILADEPIASLDPESSRLVMETLQRINQDDDITIVVTLHQVDYAQKYCRTAVALKEGEIFFIGDMNVLSAEKLTHIYGTPQATQQQDAASLPKTSDNYQLNPV